MDLDLNNQPAHGREEFIIHLGRTDRLDVSEARNIRLVTIEERRMQRDWVGCIFYRQQLSSYVVSLGSQFLDTWDNGRQFDTINNGVD